MKAEHRHELKTNELAEWLGNLPQWTKENLKTIIYISIVVVVVAGTYLYKRYEKNVVSVQKQLELTNIISQLPQAKMQTLQAQTQGIDVSYRFIQIANNLQGLAQREKDNTLAALALIKQAESLRMELHYRLEAAGRQETVTQIEKAKAGYTEAIEKASNNPSLMAMAKFGLGLCEEELGNFEQAKQIYCALAENDLLEGTVAAAQAKQRIETLSDYQQKIVFKKTPKPKAMPDIPQLKIETPDSNIPSQ